MKRIIYILLLMAMQLNGQKVLNDANKAFKKKELVEALDIYKQVLRKTRSSVVRQEVYFKMGECYNILNNYEQALKNYEQSYKEGNNEPLLYKNVGHVLLKIGEYDDAVEFFELYLEKEPNDPKVQLLLKTCNYAIANRKPIADMLMSNEKDLNSPYADYGLAMIDQILLFSSSRIERDSLGIYEVTGQSYNNFYQSEYDDKNAVWRIPIKFEGQINTPYNEGTPVYDKNESILYFMVCNGLSGKSNYCQIYTSKFDRINNAWSEPQKLLLGNEDYSYGHPAIANNGKRLFFVSDMPYGLGGKDIWYVDKKGDNYWGLPYNAGKKVNTAGDEVFPHVFNDSLLYFSSDGHLGFGGLDIFYIELSGLEQGKVKNAQMPVNSCADDFSPLIFSMDSGLMCSNRPGGVGDDDIYSFRKKQSTFSIEGYIRDSRNNQPVANALVMLSGEKTKFDTTRTNEKGEYTFSNVKTGSEYAITAHKENYLDDLVFVEPKSSAGKKKADTITRNKMDLIMMTDEEIRLENIYYDFGKWNLTEYSKKELDKLVNLLKVNPEIQIRINSHTDDVGDEAFNQELSNYRGQSVVNFLIEKGVEPSRLSYKGWGESKPIYPNADNEEERKMNRRTTFQIVNTDEIDLSYTPAIYRELAENIIVDRQDATGFGNGFESENRKEVVFRLQVYAGKRRITREFRNRVSKLTGRYNLVSSRGNDGFYRYAVGDFKKFEQAMAMQEVLKDNGVESFVIAFMNDLRITILEARQLSEKYSNY